MTTDFNVRAALRGAVIATFIGGGLAVIPANASAEEWLSAQVGVATEYLGKGVAKSNEKPSVSGSVEVTRDGFFASVFAASAELSSGADAEILTTIGYRSEFAGTGVDLMVINRDLPGTRAGGDGNYTEFQTDISRTFGPVATRFRANYTADGYGATQEAWWVELQGGVKLDRSTRLTAAIADRTADGGADYVAWNVGAKRKLNDRIAIDLRYYDTDGEPEYGDAYGGRIVAALTFSL